MTCNWDLCDRQPQLAVAARDLRRPLDAARERHTRPSTTSLTAQIGGPERRARPARARDRRHRLLARRRRRTREDARLLLGRRRVRRPGGVPLRRIVQAEDRRRRDQRRHADGRHGAARNKARAPDRHVRRAHRLHPGDDGSRRPPVSVERQLDSPSWTRATATRLGQASVGGIPIAIALSPHMLAVLTTQGRPTTGSRGSPRPTGRSSAASSSPGLQSRSSSPRATSSSCSAGDPLAQRRDRDPSRREAWDDRPELRRAGTRRRPARLGGEPQRHRSPSRPHRRLGLFGGEPLVVGVRWSFADKDAGSSNSSAIRATDDAAQRANSVRRRLSLLFAKDPWADERSRRSRRSW